MSEKPLALVHIDDLCRHLRNTMARSDGFLPRSLIRQLTGTVSWFLRQQLLGQRVIHPGMAKMAKWGECSERQARKNFAKMRCYEVVEPISYVCGGRRATRFFVNLAAIKRLLVVTGCNPSPALIEKLDEALAKVKNPELNPELTPSQNPELRPEPSSAGIHSRLETPATDTNIVPFSSHRRAG